MKKYSIATTGFANFLVILFGVSLTGCEGYGFSEHCDQNNQVLVSTEWKLYNSETEKPEMLDLYLYSDEKLSDTRHYHINDDDISLPDGNYKIIACNNAAGISLYNMDDYNRAAAILFTTNKDGELWVEQPANFVLDNNVQADTQKGEKRITILPRNILKEVSFSFVIKNYTNLKINYLAGDLSGMGSRLSLSTGKVSREEFGRQKFYAVTSEETSDIYKASFSNLGYAPKLSGQKVIKKILTVSLEYTNGASQTAFIDLTEEFDKLNEKKVINGVFELVISAQNVGLNTQQLNSLD